MSVEPRKPGEPPAPEMGEVKSDTLKVMPRILAEPVGGARPEPEEMPAVRELVLDTPVAAQTPSPLVKTDAKQIVGALTTKLQLVDTTEVFAQAGSKVCRLCHWWNNELWRKSVLPRWSHSKDPEVRRFMNQATAFLPEGEDGTADEALAMDMGLCGAMTEIFNDETVTHCAATCPTVNPKTGEAIPRLFTPKDIAHRQLSEAIYSGVMKKVGRLR